MSSKKDTNKPKKTKKILLISLSIIIILALGITAYISTTLGKIKNTEISKSDEDLGVTKLPPAEVNKDITNIALFGVDNRPGETIGRSDSIIVLSIDNLHKKIKLSSLIRDSYVSVDGYDDTKINHAYAYGGPELAIKTINQNFGLNIKDYATIDFQSMEKLIDEIDGIELNLTEKEVSYLNGYSQDQAAANGTLSSWNELTTSGNQLLNGNQALAYSRIRGTNSGDFGRSDRQRTVLSAILDKVIATGPVKFPSLVSSLAPYIETSLSQSEILKLGTTAYASGTLNFDQQRFPTDLNCGPLFIDEIYYLGFNKDINKKEIHDYIYEDIKPNGNSINVDNNNDYIKSEETNKSLEKSSNDE